MAYIHANGVNLYYEEQGAGETVVLLHAHSADRRMWDPQFDALSERYRVIRYDLRGYGLSGSPTRGERFYHYADLLGLMDALDVDKAHLVGLSLGSFVALDLLAAYPGRVLSAAVASGAVFGDGNGAATDVGPDPAFKREIDVPAFKRDWLERLLADCGPRRDRIRGELGTMVKDWSAWQPMYETALPIGESADVRRLAAADPTVPVLVLIGEDDSEGSRRSSEALLAIRPSAKAVNLAGAGHFSSMETPEAFLDAIEDFWRSARNG